MSNQWISFLIRLTTIFKSTKRGVLSIFLSFILITSAHSRCTVRITETPATSASSFTLTYKTRLISHTWRGGTRHEQISSTSKAFRIKYSTSDFRSINTIPGLFIISLFNISLKSLFRIRERSDRRQTCVCLRFTGVCVWCERESKRERGRGRDVG